MLTKKTIEALPKFYGLSAMLSFIHSKQSGVATHTMIAAAAKLANKDLPDFFLSFCKVFKCTDTSR